MSDEELERFRKEKMEEIDRWLDHEYGVSYTRLEELHDFVIDQDMKHQEEKDKEIERLHSILKEIRLKIEGVRLYSLRSGKTLIGSILSDILEILDKEDI